MAFLVPGPIALGLALSPPGPGVPGAEVTGPGYSRVTVNFLPPVNLPASMEPATLANEHTVEWPRATSLWGDIGWVTGYSVVDGSFIGWGNIVSQDGITPISVRIDRGDVARFGGTSIFLGSGYVPPRPYSSGRYGVGPYSRSDPLLAITAAISSAFDPTAVYPGAFNGQCLP
jgi:hypothetical protein